MAEKEKVLFKFGDIFFSPDYKKWEKIELVATDKNVWLKHKGGWKKFPHDSVAIVEMKHMADDASSSLEMNYKENELFVGGKKDAVYTIYNSLLSILPTSSKTAGAMKFTSDKRLVLKAIAKGVRTPGDIAYLTKLDFDDIEEIMSEFKLQGVISTSGLLTDKGKLIMLEEGYR